MHPMRENPRLPVVAVDHIRGPAKHAHSLQGCLAEEDKTFAIVSIAINIIALKIAWGINKIDRDIFANGSLEYPDLLLVGTDLHRNRIQQQLEIKTLRFHLTITRHNQAHIVPQSL